MYTYVPTTDIGRVRRTIPDRVEADAVWSDEEIQTFIDDEGDWRRASALALETMASDNALVLKVIKIGQLSTDGAKVSTALLERARQLRKLADEVDALGADGAFDIAEVIVDDFTWRSKIWNDALRLQ